ncbi:hypothetical protein LTR50_003761 [Elasticomyces elasticus]|nr:hypothetical protein LTR50_003761 [Elasticomyces elasticus]
MNYVSSTEVACHEVDQIGVIELLDQDPRPTLILDLRHAPPSAIARPIFCNTSLRKDSVLQAAVIDSLAAQHGFAQWAVSTDSERAATFSQVGRVWCGVTVRKRWRIISGQIDATVDQRRIVPDRENGNIHQDSERRGSHVAAMKHRMFNGAQKGQSQMPEDRKVIEPKLLDWIAPPAREPPNTTNHMRWVRDFDWASTELGPISTWPKERRHMVNQLLADPRPAALFLGSQRTVMYNESYKPIAGDKHPAMMGKAFLDAWAQDTNVRDGFSAVFDRIEATGQAASADNEYFVLRRYGFLEESYFSWYIMPLAGGDGERTIFYNSVFETTTQYITDRRMATLLSLSQCLAVAKDINDFWVQVLTGLEPNHYDVPFALLYAAADAAHCEDDHRRLSTCSEWSFASWSDQNWILQGTIGVPKGHPILVSDLSPDNACELLTPNFRMAVQESRPTLLQTSDGTIADALANGIPSRAFGDICQAAVILPIRAARRNALGFLVLGINPRAKYSAHYERFLQLLSSHVTSSAATILLIEEELHRGRTVARLAAQERTRLAEQLALRTQEVKDSESRFRSMADLAPVAMFRFNEAGELLYANDNWFNLTQHPRDETLPLSWYHVVDPEDHALLDKEWAKLGAGQSVSFEIRLKKPFVTDETINGEPVKGTTWIIAAAYVEKKPDGSISAVAGCLTDISRQKWAENFQERRREEAVELKRQQENFIDMTSHEMRNPLSAIILCADSIATGLDELCSLPGQNIQMSKSMIETHAEAAQTIALCAQHQKRIIDDVLALSKLDSGMLIVTPVEVQPVVAIEQALKIFRGEMHKSDVQLNFVVEPSWSDFGINWVRLDPSRLLQVLINLLTNAIKFTQTERTRRIGVSIGASAEKPPRDLQGFHYLDNTTSSTTSPQAHAQGIPVYIVIKVTDTGRGLTDDEKKLLFQRFSQASPKTHVEYGGSGLGLFISRRLAEMQGGGIGFSSEAGVGSTFAFYVEAYRCSAPKKSKALRDSVMSEDHPVSMNGSAEQKILAGTTSSTTALPDPKATAIKAQITTNVAVDQTMKMVNGSAKQHILVVEDNLVNQKVMRKQLERNGFAVSVANHGAEALAILNESWYAKGKPNGTRINVVLMDWEMPVMDGLTCVREIRRRQKIGDIIAHVPVVGVTANARNEQILDAKDAGMDTIVTKPFRMLELFAQLEAVAGVASATDRVRTSRR